MRRWTGGMQPPERGQQGAPHAEEDRGLHALPPSAEESRPPAFWSRISSAQNGEKMNFGRRSHAVRDAVAAPSGHDRAGESRLVRPAWAAWESRTPCPRGGGAHGKPKSPAVPCRPLPLRTDSRVLGVTGPRRGAGSHQFSQGRSTALRGAWSRPPWTQGQSRAGTHTLFWDQNPDRHLPISARSGPHPKRHARAFHTRLSLPTPASVAGHGPPISGRKRPSPIVKRP